MDTIKAIRTRRAEMNVPPSKKAEVLLVTATPEIYTQGLHFLERLAYASSVTFSQTAPADVSGQVSVVTANATAYMPLAELVDLAAERERIAKRRRRRKTACVLWSRSSPMRSLSPRRRKPWSTPRRKRLQVPRAHCQAGGIRTGDGAVSHCN